MKPHSDIDINAAVRRVLVRHWIDLGYVQIRTCRGVTTLTGRLDRLAASQSPLNAALVEQIQREIATVRGVRRVQFQLANWSQRASLWQPVLGT